MGGWNQSQAHAQFVADIVDFNLNIQKALEAPRFTKITFEGCDVRVESRFPRATLDDLTARGHKLMIGQPFESAMGCGQAVERNFATKVNFGASDPRKDGAAVPEPPGNRKK
jgi:gamma-glutamyltranspeptidase/glutathione hydrolase